MENIAIIPARGGSKRLPKKNYNIFYGKPLFMYSYEHAIRSKLFDKVIISTESTDILKIMQDNGIYQDYERPANLARDNSSLIDVCNDVINFYGSNNYDNICLIWATSPLIDENDLIRSYKKLRENDIDGVVACTEYTHANDLLYMDSNEFIKPLIPYNEYEKKYYNKKILFDCGAFSWIKTNNFLNEQNWVANNSMPYILPYYKGVDLDTKEDLELLEFYFEKYAKKKKTK